VRTWRNPKLIVTKCWETVPGMGWLEHWGALTWGDVLFFPCYYGLLLAMCFALFLGVIVIGDLALSYYMRNRALYAKRGVRTFFEAFQWRLSELAEGLGGEVSFVRSVPGCATKLARRPSAERGAKGKSNSAEANGEELWSEQKRVSCKQECGQGVLREEAVEHNLGAGCSSRGGATAEPNLRTRTRAFVLALERCDQVLRKNLCRFNIFSLRNDRDLSVLWTEKNDSKEALIDPDLLETATTGGERLRKIAEVKGVLSGEQR
jgi:hypothetical protein